MENGFYPALGTPVDNNGVLLEASYAKQIELMIGAGASGLLCMGSMGQMESIKNAEYLKVATKCVEVTAGRLPVMVGVMDCSLARVLDRVEQLNKLDIQGIVATLPFYYKIRPADGVNFFKQLAERSKFPVYVYDLPSVTQTPITYDMMVELSKVKGIKGIKTANMVLISELQRNKLFDNDFSYYFSNLDLFDNARAVDIKKNLDGMYTCTPVNSKEMYKQEAGSFAYTQSLTNILKLRNLFIKENVLAAYSYAMELINCPGNYHPDYAVLISDGLKKEIKECMIAIGEIKG